MDGEQVRRTKLRQDDVISALIGLVGACNNNPKTANTDKLILTALAYSNGENEAEFVKRIHAEKHVIAPDCATCATPCGNTSDYDMSRIYNAEPMVRIRKEQILNDICRLAECILQKEAAQTEQNILLLYKALSYVSYEWNEDALLAISEEISQTIARIRGKDL